MILNNSAPVNLHENISKSYNKQVFEHNEQIWSEMFKHLNAILSVFILCIFESLKQYVYINMNFYKFN